jgi:hypothetical protein
MHGENRVSGAIDVFWSIRHRRWLGSVRSSSRGVDGEISGERREAGGIVEEVPSSHPSRFVEETADPLEAGGLHPAGGARRSLRDELELGSDAEESYTRDAWSDAIHPQLLLGIPGPT